VHQKDKNYNSRIGFQIKEMVEISELVTKNAAPPLRFEGRRLLNA